MLCNICKMGSTKLYESEKHFDIDEFFKSLLPKRYVDEVVKCEDCGREIIVKEE